jgi:hypothetical protein
MESPKEEQLRKKAFLGVPCSVDSPQKPKTERQVKMEGQDC